MKPALDDLRILRLAELYERACEAFLREVASRATDERVRHRLEALAPPGELHSARIRAHLDRITANLSAEEQEELERAALLDVVELERGARAFYLRHVDDVHDPAVVRLFQDLLREEDARVRIAEDALDAHPPRRAWPRRPPVTP